MYMELINMPEMKVVCPFRTLTTTTQTPTSLTQEVTYPECQYNQCPFYNSEGRDASEKCFRTAVGV